MAQPQWASVHQQLSRQKEQVGGSFICRAGNCDYAFLAPAGELSPRKSPGTGLRDKKMKMLIDKTWARMGMP